MRLFPSGPIEPGHEAVTNIDNQSIGIIAGLSAVSAGLALKGNRLGGLRSSNRNVALLTRCVAYGTAAALPFALYNRYVEQRIKAHTVQSENSAVPRTVFVDRLSRFDSDNAIILGGLTGIFIAWRLRKSGSITGWRRYAAAASVGAAPPTIAFWISGMVKQGQDEPASTSSDLVLRPVLSDLELASASDFVRSIMDYAWSGGAVPAKAGPEDRPGNDGTSMAMLGLGGGSSGGSSGSSGSWQTHSGPAGVEMPLEILTDKPHIAVKQGNKEPEFQPQTNYGWYSENKIAELEQQIATMREKRQQLAQEAEFVWAWLAEKEAEYLEKYPVTKKREEGDEKPSEEAMLSSMLVQSLGQVHSSIWREASACDWIIADSQKRIAQEKSLSATGKVQWRSSCSEAAAASPLKTTLEVLKGNIDVQKQLRNQVDQGLSALAMSLADPYADLNQKAMHPIKKQMASQKEIIKDVREHMEEQKKVAELFGQTLKKAIEEAERRAGRG